MAEQLNRVVIIGGGFGGPNVITLDNQLLVLFQWFWSYVTRNRSARLITDEEEAISNEKSPRS
jgi:hypothetical protein